MSKTSKKVSDAVKPALSDALAGQAYAALVAITGFGWVFALPVVSSVTRYVIGRITGWAVQETAVGLSLLWIVLEMSYEVGNVEDATKKLKDMLDNPAKYSLEQQAEIEESFDAKAIDLIQLSIARL